MASSEPSHFHFLRSEHVSDTGKKLKHRNTSALSPGAGPSRLSGRFIKNKRQSRRAGPVEVVYGIKDTKHDSTLLSETVYVSH